MKLLLNAFFKFLIGLVSTLILIFVPAGTFGYTNGWLFVALLFIPILILGVILFIKAPELLRKRLDGREKDKSQKGVVALSGLLFFVGFIVAGLDFRFGWSEVPVWLVVLSSVVLLASYVGYAYVMSQNRFLSRKIEIQDNQKVIDTGLYGIIRHPMYSVTILLFLSIPIVLGSWFSFVLFLHYPILIVVRLKNEEKFLEENLIGYSEYKNKVKYRLIPYLW